MADPPSPATARATRDRVLRTHSSEPGQGWPVVVAAIVALVLAALPADAAATATHEVFAVDPPTSSTNVWSPGDVVAEIGDTVRWHIEAPRANDPHNLRIENPDGSERAVWAGGDPDQGPVPPFEQRFDEPGVYPFVCMIHSGTMFGQVRVGGAAPPPSGSSPAPNPLGPPGALETGDNDRPELSGVRLRGVRHGARVRLRLSEPGRVSIRFLERRGGKRRQAARFRLRRLDAERTSRTVRDPRLDRGRYRVTLRAIDRAGNRSRVESEAVHVEG